MPLMSVELREIVFLPDRVVLHERRDDSVAGVQRQARACGETPVERKLGFAFFLFFLCRFSRLVGIDWKLASFDKLQ